MFNLLTGALRANSGEIAFAGRSITRDQQFHIARVRHCPHLPARQAAPAHDAARQRAARHLFAHQNRPLRRRAAPRTGPKRRSARYEALQQLERVGLGDKPFELAGNLPLGNQRVLEIARALAADPTLLVLDEPAAGLRRQEKLKLAELLRSLRADHLTILLVEHDMEFVMSLVDRIVVLDFGSKLCEGDAGGDPQRRPRPGSLSRRCRVTQMFSIENVSVAYGKVEAVRERLAFASSRGRS